MKLTITLLVRLSFCCAFRGAALAQQPDQQGKLRYIENKDEMTHKVTGMIVLKANGDAHVTLVMTKFNAPQPLTLNEDGKVVPYKGPKSDIMITLRFQPERPSIYM